MKERNRDILKRAIKQLPDFKPGKPEIWNNIELELEKSEKMESKLKARLPVFKAPETFWTKIEAKLEVHDQVLRNAINRLPDFKAPTESWKRISLNLDSSIPTRRINYRVLVRVAAAAVMIFSIGFGIIKLKNRESHQALPEFTRTENSEFHYEMNEGINSIYTPALCKSNPQICKTELFKLLDKQRLEIEGEILIMEPMIKDGDLQLMKYYHRLVNEQVEIEKRMVKLIIES